MSIFILLIISFFRSFWFSPSFYAKCLKLVLGKIILPHLKNKNKKSPGLEKLNSCKYYWVLFHYRESIKDKKRRKNWSKGTGERGEKKVKNEAKWQKKINRWWLWTEENARVKKKVWYHTEVASTATYTSGVSCNSNVSTSWATHLSTCLVLRYQSC